MVEIVFLAKVEMEAMALGVAEMVEKEEKGF